MRLGLRAQSRTLLYIILYNMSYDSNMSNFSQSLVDSYDQVEADALMKSLTIFGSLFYKASRFHDIGCLFSNTT